MFKQNIQKLQCLLYASYTTVLMGQAPCQSKASIANNCAISIPRGQCHRHGKELNNHDQYLVVMRGIPTTAVCKILRTIISTPQSFYVRNLASVLTIWGLHLGFPICLNRQPNAAQNPLIKITLTVGLIRLVHKPTSTFVWSFKMTKHEYALLLLGSADLSHEPDIAAATP